MDIALDRLVYCENSSMIGIIWNIFYYGNNKLIVLCGTDYENLDSYSSYNFNNYLTYIDYVYPINQLKEFSWENYTKETVPEYILDNVNLNIYFKANSFFENYTEDDKSIFIYKNTQDKSDFVPLSFSDIKKRYSPLKEYNVEGIRKFICSIQEFYHNSCKKIIPKIDNLTSDL